MEMKSVKEKTGPIRRDTRYRVLEMSCSNHVLSNAFLHIFHLSFQLLILEILNQDRQHSWYFSLAASKQMICCYDVVALIRFPLHPTNSQFVCNQCHATSEATGASCRSSITH